MFCLLVCLEGVRLFVCLFVLFYRPTNPRESLSTAVSKVANSPEMVQHTIAHLERKNLFQLNTELH